MARLQNNRLPPRPRAGHRLALAFALALALTPGHAAADSIVSQVSLGVLDHDVHAFGGKENGADINGEIQFASPVGAAAVQNLPSWLGWLCRPKPTLGLDLNTNGYTNQYYADLTWTATPFTDILQPGDGLFFSLGLGPAVNNGHVNGTLARDRKKLGSNVLFHLTGEIGYDISPRWSVSLYYEHSSNAGFARYNQSLNNAGLRLAWRF